MFVQEFLNSWFNFHFFILSCYSAIHCHVYFHYRWDEVNQIIVTAYEACDKTFVFAIELHRMKTDVIQAHLQRAYVCPPEQLEEAMASDRVWQ